MSPPSNSMQQFVVLPTRGLRATQPTSSSRLGPFLMGLGSVVNFASAKSFVAAEGLTMKPRFRVIDSIHEDGAKLVEMTAQTAKDLLASQPGLRIVPVVYYRSAVSRYEIESKQTAKSAIKTVITVMSKKLGKPIQGALVVAFTDFVNRVGAQGTTNAKGVVKLPLMKGKIERVYVYPKQGFWGGLRKNVDTTGGVQIGLRELALDFVDALRHFYGNSVAGMGTGVTVGIVDTGIGPHKDLVVAGGENTVVAEDPNDFADNGDGHGTHVAGIVAARGTPPSGIRGLAPGVTLRSYRVFGKNSEGASNFSIAKAIDRAVSDDCDIVNLSLGGDSSDPATESAVNDARQMGTLVVGAAGNEDRSPVSFPAAHALCIAVSAMGRKGTFPSDSTESGDVLAPFGSDRDDFIAGFSNIGPEIDLTSTGVGIISTVPGGYLALSGTSMACPAVSGFAARVLATNSSVLAMPRDQHRSDQIAKLVLMAAKTRGFTPIYEGGGLAQ